MKERYRKTAVEELGEAAVNMYAKGWAERNGGNISCLLTQEEAEEIAGADAVLRQIPLDTEMKGLAGQYILVTGTGKYFKNMEKDPENNMGIVRISADGKNAELIWGLNDGGNVTSEFSSHLMTHRNSYASHAPDCYVVSSRADRQGVYQYALENVYRMYSRFSRWHRGDSLDGQRQQQNCRFDGRKDERASPYPLGTAWNLWNGTDF